MCACGGRVNKASVSQTQTSFSFFSLCQAFHFVFMFFWHDYWCQSTPALYSLSSAPLLALSVGGTLTFKPKPIFWTYCIRYMYLWTETLWVWTDLDFLHFNQRKIDLLSFFEYFTLFPSLYLVKFSLKNLSLLEKIRRNACDNILQYVSRGIISLRRILCLPDSARWLTVSEAQCAGIWKPSTWGLSGTMR